MSLPSVLVFPSNMPEAVSFARIAREMGLTVVSATSETIDQTQQDAGVVSLPYVTDPQFEHAFADMLVERQITLVFTPHETVWCFLQSLSQREDLPVKFRVCNEFPLTTELRPYISAYEWAESCFRDQSLPQESLPPLALHRYARLHQEYNQIPGQCDDMKLALLASIARQAVPGDIVEVGSLYGRSAFALAWLAKFHQIGSLVCVDPWNFDSIKDQGGEAKLVNRIVGGRDWELTFRSFLVSMSDFNHVNYIRQPSMQAVRNYQAAAEMGSIHSLEFGAVPLSGGISILHIDGNHKYEEVKQDVDEWLPMLKSGGWLLLDDYVWAFGDGPKQVGDELLQQHSVKNSFVIGDTLCVQF